MIEDISTVFGIFIKYGIYFFFICFGIALISSFLSKLRNEPRTLFKLIFVALTPFACAISIPYFVLYEMIGAPFWLNLIAGFAIYAVTTDFLDKRFQVKFKDETEQ